MQRSFLAGDKAYRHFIGRCSNFTQYEAGEYVRSIGDLHNMSDLFGRGLCNYFVHEQK